MGKLEYLVFGKASHDCVSSIPLADDLIRPWEKSREQEVYCAISQFDTNGVSCIVPNAVPTLCGRDAIRNKFHTNACQYIIRSEESVSEELIFLSEIIKYPRHNM